MDRAIILAAGEGTRMKSKKSKVLHSIIDRPIIEYIMDAARESLDDLLVIVGNNEKEFVEKYPDVKTKKQEIGSNIPYGTGYACLLALEEIDDDGDLVVLAGDTPLIKAETIKKLLKTHKENDNSATVLTCEMDNPYGYGRIVRENGKFEKIVEHKDASEEELKIKEINSAIYAFKTGEIKKAIKKLDVDNAQGELYLTDVIGIFSKEGKNISTYKLDPCNKDEIRGINDRIQLSQAEGIMRDRINQAWMKKGVSMQNPSSIFIGKDVEIGTDTSIGQNVSIYGNTKIGENCIIKSNSTIVDSILESDVTIDNSVIEKSYVEEGADIGPFSHLRPNARLGKKVHIGNFVEVKNATMGEGSKAGHLAYVGDTDVGKNVNIGCGAIFVNYDGKFKHRSVVKDNAFIGSNSNIIAPVTVEEEGYIAAGSTITKNVGIGDLSIERAEQKNIKGYVEKKKARDKLKEEKK